jgi:type II secretory ATPase GspE/PulE/Tfp pilus assembly ATPase PilB-like protein
MARAGAQFPEFLAKNFARILQRVELLWGTREAVEYLDSLFLRDDTDLSDRSERKGFPIEAMNEIVLLKQVHQFLYPTLSKNPFDPFNGSDVSAPAGIPAKAKAPGMLDFEKVSVQGSGSEKNFSGDVGSGLSRTVSAEIPGPEAKLPGKEYGGNQPLTGGVDWPVIRTQHELFENAELLRKGESTYALQGKNMGEILLHYGLVDEHTLRIVSNMQKKPEHNNQVIGELLVEIGIINQEQLARTLNIQAGIPMVDVLSISIPPEITEAIPNAKAREKLAVPIANYHDTLYLAVAEPFTFTDQSFFTVMTGMKVSLVYAPMHEIINRLNIHGFGKRSTGATKEEFRNLAMKDTDFPAGKPVAEEIVGTDVSENDSIIVNLVNQMILNAIQEEASDIHIELFNDGEEASIRFRRDGNMEHFSGFPRAYHKAVVSRIKIMSGLDISEMRRPQDGKISFNIPNDGRVDLRVATIPAMLGAEFVTIRILPSGEPLPLGNLGMANRDMKVFRGIFQRPYGLILVCGPTGSGKTTTLHSVLKELNTEDRKIWTAEDPVEIVQPHLCQVQVNSKIGMTFATVLRSLLRADPDVIMIGEMRDQETAKIALEASMTGHLVLSTLHTNSASETVSRLLDLDIDPYNLSDALLAILAQRLARKLCTACARREEASVGDLEDLANEYYQSAHSKPPAHAERSDIIQEWRENFGVNGKLFLGRAVGCKMCSGGYKGRIGLYELLQATPSLRHLIRQQSAASEYLTTGVADGMRTLKQDGIEKVIRGITDMMQVHGACV